MEFLFLAFIGLIVGTAVGLTGVGGGAVMTPLLIIFTNLELAAVIAVDLMFASITKTSAAINHAKNKNIDWGILKSMWWGSIPAVIIVLFLVITFNLFALNFLLPFIGVVLIISGVLMGVSHESQSFSRSLENRFPDQFHKIQNPLTTLGGSLIGTLVALTSIGAGAIGAIMLRALHPLKMRPKILVGTDTTHAIPVAFIAGLGYLSFGYLDWKVLGCLLVGSIPGSLLGSYLTDRLKPHWVKVMLGLAIMVSGIKLTFF